MIVMADIVENSGAYVRVSDQRLMLKRAFQNAGEFWHRNYRGRHFTRGAFQRYRYTPRTGRYTQRKQKYLGHTDPLVFSGVSRDRTLQKDVVATHNSARVRMPAGNLGFNPRGGRIRMRDEVTQINQQEHQILSQRMHSELVKRLNTYATSRRIRIR